MTFSVDFDGIEMGSGGGVPAGRYNLRIVAAKETVSKKGDPMVMVDYEIMDGQYAGRPVKFHCVVFFKDKTSNGAWMSKLYLKTIGLPSDGSVNVDATQWIGRCLVGKIELEKNKNKPEDKTEYPRVKFFEKYEIDYTIPVENNFTNDVELVPF